MTQNDIQKIKNILQIWERNDLAELLSKSYSKIRRSDLYHNGNVSCTFEVYSPIKQSEKLKNLSKEDKELILQAVREIYPVKKNKSMLSSEIEFNPEVNNLKFYYKCSNNDEFDTIESFWSNIHSNIANVSKDLFNNKHYPEAVFSALKEVNIQVKKIYKEKTGKEKDGTALMFNAFKLDDLIIKLGDTNTETGRDIQKGYMHLFAGAMLGIRNPKAHNHIQINRNRAIHFLYLASLLMYKLEDAKVLN